MSYLARPVGLLVYGERPVDVRPKRTQRRGRETRHCDRCEIGYSACDARFCSFCGSALRVVSESRAGAVARLLTPLELSSVPDSVLPFRHPTAVHLQLDAGSAHNLYAGFSGAWERGGGLFVATGAPAAPSTSVVVEVLVVGTGPYLLQGEVAWLREPGRGELSVPSGMGIELRHVPPAASGALSLFAKLREPLFYVPE